MPLLNSLGSTFPTYILPTIPFRRRSSASTTTSTLSSSSSSGSSPPTTSSAAAAAPAATADPFLATQTSLLRCNRCLAQISTTTQIISKGFTGRHGRAYLVSPTPSSVTTSTTSTSTGTTGGVLLPNTNVGKPQQRQLVTGLHTVCDVSCALCGSVLGWKYVAAEEEGQKYKVGKFILETKRVMRDMVWEADMDAINDEDDRFHTGAGAGADAGAGAVDERVEFDSQDEDECEDLFMGIWSEKLASKRRRDKAWRMES